MAAAKPFKALGDLHKVTGPLHRLELSMSVRDLDEIKKKLAVNKKAVKYINDTSLLDNEMNPIVQLLANTAHDIRGDYWKQEEYDSKEDAETALIQKGQMIPIAKKLIEISVNEERSRCMRMVKESIMGKQQEKSVFCCCASFDTLHPPPARKGKLTAAKKDFFFLFQKLFMTQTKKMPAMRPY